MCACVCVIVRARQHHSLWLSTIFIIHRVQYVTAVFSQHFPIPFVAEMQTNKITLQLCAAQCSLVRCDNQVKKKKIKKKRPAIQSFTKLAHENHAEFIEVKRNRLLYLKIPVPRDHPRSLHYFALLKNFARVCKPCIYRYNRRVSRSTLFLPGRFCKNF